MACLAALSAGCGGPERAADGPTGSASEPGDTTVHWIGRVDLSDPELARFSWSGTGFSASVSGSSVSVTLRSESGTDPVYYQPVVDGTVGERFSVAASEADKTVSLGSGLGAGEHRVELYRETEGKPGFAQSVFVGFAQGTPGDPPPSSGRRLEIVGDSISAGYGNLGSEEHPNYGPDPSGGCHFSTETESAYLAYGAIAGRALGADVSIVAASGWGIHSDNGGNTNNVLPTIYGNTLGGLPTLPWGFKPEPAAVVINLGTNDFSADMNLAADAFTAPYLAFIATVRGKYPDAWIYCAIGPLLYDVGLVNARQYIGDMVASLNAEGDGKVKVLDFGQQNTTLGTGCDYHPSVAEHQRMADMLASVLRADLGW
jgi:lysophospholipase L1-like esterase